MKGKIRFKLEDLVKEASPNTTKATSVAPVAWTDGATTLTIS